MISDKTIIRLWKWSGFALYFSFMTILNFVLGTEAFLLGLGGSLGIVFYTMFYSFERDLE